MWVPWITVLKKWGSVLFCRYTRLGSGPILPSVEAEDPSLWVDKRGNFHYLMHYIPDGKLVARHAFASNYQGPWQIHTNTVPCVAP